jgi:Fe-S-cluster containining protein
MAAFECDRCGKCCVSLGPLITCERQLNDRDYYCHSTIDNTIFLARVDPEYREEISDEFAAGDQNRTGPDTKACTFLRKKPGSASTACAIHAARPKICRDFRCYRMLIRNREGNVCGRVIGKTTLRTEDAALATLWKDLVEAIPSGNTTAWTEKVAGILSEHNYCADIVE